MHLRTAALSDIGKVRSENEDSYLCDESAGLFAVADGVGGLPCGADASQMAVNTVRDLYRALPEGEVIDLVQIVRETNARVLALGHKVSPELGIATTLTLGMITCGQLYLAHVGDSRCYVWHDGQLDLLTLDHSLENEANLRGAQRLLAYFTESNRASLTRCIGQSEPPEVDLLVRPVAAGERVLFCSDGLSRVIKENELKEILGRADNPADAMKEIIENVNRRGGPDNITGVLVAIDEV
ncbi:MAG TPA: protein phosphatase 2C domain-containing protein [Opitutaceae bacterium]|jgi:serine/threonine protein phosphatase PrpC|nr:protein phosphatase 2C domain-containing protein [Opitutaceae bacterium]